MAIRRTAMRQFKIALIVCYLAIELTGRRIFIAFDSFAGCRIYYGPGEFYRGVHDPIKGILRGNQPIEELSSFFFKGNGSSQGLREASTTVMGEAIQRLLNPFHFQSDSQLAFFPIVLGAEASAMTFAPPRPAALSPPVPRATPPQLNI